MKKLLLTLIIGLGLAGLANATLWDFYNGDLPSVADRVSEATECGISDYTGTYDQNIKLEYCLLNKGVLGASTSTVTTPAPSLYKNQTWTGINTYTSSTISSGNNTWTGTNSFSSTTSLSTTTVGGINIDPLIFGTSTALHYHDSNVGQFTSSSMSTGDTGLYFTVAHGLSATPKKIRLHNSFLGSPTANSDTVVGSCQGYWSNRQSTVSTSTQYSTSLTFDINEANSYHTEPLSGGSQSISDCSHSTNVAGIQMDLWSVDSTNFILKIIGSYGDTMNIRTTWEAEL